MVYALIFLFQGLGIFFHVMQKVVSIGDKFPRDQFPEYTIQRIFYIFWSEDWDTLTISAGILVLDEAVHFVVFDYLHIPLPIDWYWQIGPFGLALVLGYAGQRLIYKWFGTAEQFLDKQVSNKLSS